MKEKQLINKPYQNLKTCFAKDTVKKINMPVTEQEKIFANHISDIRFVSRVCKEFSKFSNMETTMQLKMGQKT